MTDDDGHNDRFEDRLLENLLAHHADVTAQPPARRRLTSSRRGRAALAAGASVLVAVAVLVGVGGFAPTTRVLAASDVACDASGAVASVSPSRIEAVRTVLVTADGQVRSTVESWNYGLARRTEVFGSTGALISDASWTPRTTKREGGVTDAGRSVDYKSRTFSESTHPPAVRFWNVASLSLPPAALANLIRAQVAGGLFTKLAHTTVHGQTVLELSHSTSSKSLTESVSAGPPRCQALAQRAVAASGPSGVSGPSGSSGPSGPSGASGPSGRSGQNFTSGPSGDSGPPPQVTFTGPSGVSGASGSGRTWTQVATGKNNALQVGFPCAKSWTVWVDSTADLPVRSVTPLANGGRAVTTFSWLAPTAANLALLTAPVPHGFVKVAGDRAQAPPPGNWVAATGAACW